MCYQFCETLKSISVLYATTNLLHSLYNRFSIKFKVMKKFFKFARLAKTITHSYELQRIGMVFCNNFSNCRTKSAVNGMLFCNHTATRLFQRSKNCFSIKRLYAKRIDYLSRNTFLLQQISCFEGLIDFHTACNKRNVGSFAQYIRFTHFQLNFRSIYRRHACTTHANIHWTWRLSS